MAACAALVAVALGARDSSFSLELSDGCEELAACSRLEAEAERRLVDCWLVCRSEVVQLQRARLLRYRAEERSLVRDHYAKRNAADRAEALATAQREQKERERERAERERASEREHERRMELERLRQEHVDRAASRERERRLSYLALLGPDERKQRLRHCHEKSGRCEQLVLDLVESTTDKAEQRAIAVLHERLLRGLGARPPEPKPKSAEPAVVASAPSS